MKAPISKLIKVTSVFAMVSLASCSQMTSTTATTSESAAARKKNASLVKRGLPETPSQKALAKAAKITKKDKHGYKTYSDKERTRVVRTTAYSHMEREVGAPGRKNCIGGTLKYGSVRSAAADWSVYPVGTKFRVKGQPHIYLIDDYGSALVGTNTIDIFHPTLRLMRNWGTRKAEITIIQWGDYDRSLRILSKRRGYKHCRKMYTQLKSRMHKGEVASVEKSPVTPAL